MQRSFEISAWHVSGLEESALSSTFSIKDIASVLSQTMGLLIIRL